MKRAISLTIAVAGLLTAALAIPAAEPAHEHTGSGEVPSDVREMVRFPEQVRIHTLANMRDHLLALQQIQEALGSGAYDRAADIAEQRLGMSSLQTHGAHELASWMPEGMRKIGTEMHRAASRFAVAARDVGATAEFEPALSALSKVIAQCVACHAAYRVQ